MIRKNSIDVFARIKIVTNAEHFFGANAVRWMDV